jgi:DNA polymerase III sliding clamp (beta) subunit (PCNA family)
MTTRKKINMDGSSPGKHGKILPGKRGEEERSAKISTLVDAIELMKPIFQMKTGGAESVSVVSFSDRFISAFNGYQCLSVEHSVKGFPTISVDGDKLYRYLRDSKQKSFDFKVEKNQFVVETKEYSFGLSYMLEETMSQQLVEGFKYDRKNWKPLPEDLLEAMILCSFYAAKEEWKGSLMGVYVSGTDVLSSDNYRISWYKTKGKIDQSFLMPAAGANILYNVKPTHYVQEDEWIHFRAEGVYYSSVLLGELFPKTAKTFFPKELPRGVELPEELGEMLNKVAIIQSEKKSLEQVVVLEIKEGRLHISAETERGWFKTSLEIPGEAPRKLKLKINPIFLKQAMKYATKLYIIEDTKALFKSENFRHIVVL